MSWAYSILGAVTSLTSVRLQADSVPVPKWCASTVHQVCRECQALPTEPHSGNGTMANLASTHLSPHNPVRASRFRVFHSDCTLHSAITHMISILERRRLSHDYIIGINVRLHLSNTVITRKGSPPEAVEKSAPPPHQHC